MKEMAAKGSILIGKLLPQQNDDALDTKNSQYNTIGKGYNDRLTLYFKTIFQLHKSCSLQQL